MIKTKIKGLWMPLEVIMDKTLSDKEKMIYSLLIFYSYEKKYSIVNNRYLSELLGVSITQISKLISSLQKKSYIRLEITYPKDNKLSSRKITPLKLFENNHLTKVKDGTEENLKLPIEEKFKENNIYNFKNRYKKQFSYLSNNMECNYDYDFSDKRWYANLRDE